MVLMMGALHIEDKAQQMVGKILHDSGWTSILSRAQILTTGRAQSALNENHIKRTRYTHQVSVVSLKYLKHLAYIQNCPCVLGPPESFDMWYRQTCVEVPQFKYWFTIIDLELLLCRFVRSLREGDFALYVQVCDELCSWFHVMDHTNYARWLPVHVRDMVQLSEKHPTIHDVFLKGNFVVQKSPHKFSLIAKDHAHEQSNKILQSHRGVVGLYENPEALALFMLAGPDCTKIVQQFEGMFSTTSSSISHHEEAHGLQMKFYKDVMSFVGTVKQMGSPFLATDTELVALDTQDVMEPEVAAPLSLMPAIGETWHAEYTTQRLQNPLIPVSDTIPHQNIFTFANRPDLKKKTLVSGGKIWHSSHNSFCRSNQREPPSLTGHGTPRTGVKSHVIDCISAPIGHTIPSNQVTVVLLDMAAVVHMILPTNAQTFSEYVTKHIIPYMK